MDVRVAGPFDLREALEGNAAVRAARKPGLDDPGISKP
jgi:hypothetical protein